MIGYIEFENAIKLGDLKLNFLKNDKESYNTIVLAGENGCGKTAILEAIAEFQKGIYLGESSDIKKVIYFDGKNRRYEILREEESKIYPEEWLSEDDFNSIRFELEDKAPYDIRNRDIVFSEARSGFEVDFNSDCYIDDFEEQKYEKDGANYSGIIRLLIDLEEKDNNEYITYAKFNSKCTYEEYMNNNSHIAKFKRAFEKMFDNLSYMGKDPTRLDNTIYFIKDGKQINITDLSTGEQQIVFRGTDLLYHTSNGVTVLIDEPELSLHPKWQRKILDFYRNLFTDEEGIQTAQLIIATHSQYVVQSAIEDSSSVKTIILQKEKQKIRSMEMKEVLLGVHCSAEINYLVFGVEKLDYHIQLFGALHSLLQEMKGSKVDQSISSVDRYIMNHKFYDSSIYEREDLSFHHYYTLPVYIRNAIDHPENKRLYSNQDLDISIGLMRNIYIDLKCR